MPQKSTRAYNDLDDETLVKTLLAKYPITAMDKNDAPGRESVRTWFTGCIEQEHAKVAWRGRVPLSGAAGRLRQWHTVRPHNLAVHCAGRLGRGRRARQSGRLCQALRQLHHDRQGCEPFRSPTSV